LNVYPDLKGFKEIIPCGIEDKPLGSLEQLIPNIKLSKIRQEVALAFANVFQVEIVSKYSFSQENLFNEFF
jgi:lipoyl(octanoyl) transferase